MVDPVLADDAPLREVCEKLIRIVRSAWTDLPSIDVDDPEIEAFLSRHRVTTLIPLEAVPDGSRESFADRLRSVYVGQMRIEATAKQGVAALVGAGIDCRLLKGLASAYLDYPHPELRHTGDVDLAVRPGDFGEAQVVLSGLGWRRKPDRGASVVIKGATFDAARRVEVDLHDRLFVRSRPSDLLFERPGVDVPALGLVALPAEERLFNAAGAFILSPVGRRRLSGLVDMIRILDDNELDFERVRLLADESRVAGLVGATLRLEGRLTGRSVPALCGWPEPDRLDRMTRFGSQRRLMLEHIVRLRHVPPGERLGYLPTWLRPDAKDRARLRSGFFRTRERAGG